MVALPVLIVVFGECIYGSLLILVSVYTGCPLGVQETYTLLHMGIQGFGARNVEYLRSLS